jgi:hypothetical protein
MAQNSFRRSLSEALFELLMDPGAEMEMTKPNTEQSTEGTTSLRVESSEQEPLDTASFEPAVNLEVEPGTTKPAQRSAVPGVGW